MRFAFTLLLALAFMIQVAFADVNSQLQFMKITSPTSGQSIKAGEEVLIKYVMQPLVLKGTSKGFVKSLEINFHKRTGDQKQGLLANIYPACPVTANEDKYKTHSYRWTVPENTVPGSYAFDFVQVAQFRHHAMTIAETVKVNIID